MEKFRIFISQPMKDKTQSEIEFERDCIIDEIQKYHCEGKNVEFIYSIITSEPNNLVRNEPVWYLAKSIDLLSTADMVVFGKGWEEARGCRIEHEICDKYGILTLHYNGYNGENKNE